MAWACLFEQPLYSSAANGRSGDISLVPALCQCHHVGLLAHLFTCLCHHLVLLICLFECLLCPNFTRWQSGQDCLHDFHVLVFPFFVLDMYVCHVLALTHSGLGLPVFIYTVSQR